MIKIKSIFLNGFNQLKDLAASILGGAFLLLYFIHREFVRGYFKMLAQQLSRKDLKNIAKLFGGVFGILIVGAYLGFYMESGNFQIELEKWKQQNGINKIYFLISLVFFGIPFIVGLLIWFVQISASGYNGLEKKITSPDFPKPSAGLQSILYLLLSLYFITILLISWNLK